MDMLKSSVCDYLSYKDFGLPLDIPLMVRIYASVNGLAKVYRATGTIDQTSDFELFVRGFNKAYPLFDFVDAGDGKECADEKVRRKNSPTWVIG